MDDALLDPRQSNYLAAVSPGDPIGIAWVEISTGRFQAAGGVQDARADPHRQGLQHGLVALTGVGDADQALLGRGQQQRPDRAVDGPVGHVQDAVALGGGRQPVM